MFTACEPPPDLKYVPEDMPGLCCCESSWPMAWAGHLVPRGHEQEASLSVWVQFEAELAKTGGETEILIFEQTWVLVKPQTHLQNSHNFNLSGRETGV